ncbi:MAG: HlyD family efflux transporter periplasmic adaptor subunit [Butyrivibrio sp.]|jgi:HlyD family secretion protein|nr:HlyD family efflux transporter periplasmic adaptor subunit [Butyrivibrio sp.]
MKSKKFWIRLVLLAVVAGCIISLVVYTLWIKPSQSTDSYIYKETKVAKGDIVLGIEESGSVEMASSELDYNLTIDSDDSDDSSSTSDSSDDDDSTRYLKVEDVYVSQGQTITKGDKLFKLTSTSVGSVRRLLEADESDAKLTLEEAQQEYETGKLEASDTKQETDSAAADASELYGATLTELQAAIDGYEGDIEALTQEVQSLQEDVTDTDLLKELKEAKEDMETAQDTLEDTDVSNFGAYTANQSAYDTAKSTYDSIQDGIDTKKKQITTDLATIKSDQKKMEQAQAAFKEKQTEAENTHDSSVLNGKLSKDVYSNSVNSLGEAVTQAQTALDEAQTNLNDFNSFVGDDGIIYADGSGVVTAVNYDAGDSIKTTGAMITYTKSDAYTVSIDVSEEDISSITVGDAVDITFTAYSDTAYKGKVTAISTTASDDHATTVSYPVTIAIEGDTSKLYGGMTADVTFVTDSVSDVLYVSEQAIVEQNDKSYVYEKSGDTYTLIPVETGFSNGSDIEIKSGLKEGDTVYIASKVTADETQLKDTSAVESSSGTAASSQTESGNGQNQNGMPSGQGMPAGGGMPSGGGMKGGN